jgi:hypothetical protein
MKKFEYIIRENLYLRELNEYGANGWELVSIIWVSNETRFYFKREII